MVEDTLQARGRSMEDAFFARRQGRRGAAAPAPLAAFADDGLIGNERLRSDLDAHHLDSGTIAAMTLVPLVAIAWADRTLHARERAAVLKAAEGAGIAAGSESHALLASWLDERPDPELFERWKSFVAALCADMDAGDVEALRADLLGRARAIAQANGGLLGLRRISAREREVLDEIEHAFPA